MDNLKFHYSLSMCPERLIDYSQNACKFKHIFAIHHALLLKIDETSPKSPFFCVKTSPKKRIETKREA